jgi:two-component system response regulator PilR (NtrC family)
MAHILVVDDELSMREFLAILLRKGGHRVSAAASGDDALAIAQRDRPDLVVTDLKMPGMPGQALISRLKAHDPDVPIVVITAFSTWDSTVEAMRLGAHDYVRKPFDNEEIRDVIERALSRRKILEETRGRTDVPELHQMVGNSPKMREVLDIVRRVAPAESTILIQGESGTGKELVARMIHYYSPRAAAPFITVNCGGLPESLLESELFGHMKGTFTGAHADKKGLIQLADGGTFFLDEIGEMPLAIQVKLLRVLEERQFYALGGTKPIRIDVRFVSATNRDLAEEVRRGKFRSDLFFRLNVIPITLPPLRAREGDIPLLAGYFLRKYAAAMGREITGIAPEAQAKLESYPWPGNVRELENAIQRAIALARGPVIEDIMLGGGATPLLRGEAARAAGPAAAPARSPSEAQLPLTAAAPGGENGGGRRLDETWRIPARRAYDDLPTPSGVEARVPDGAAGPEAAPAGAIAQAEALALLRLPEGGFDLERQLEAIERRYIEEALARCGGNLTRASALLGISFRSIRYKVKKLGIRASQRGGEDA